MAGAFDTLTAAEALQDAGIDPKHARAIVATARDAAGAGRSELATKTDLAALESRLIWRMVGIVAVLLAAQGALIVALLKPSIS